MAHLLTLFMLLLAPSFAKSSLLILERAGHRPSARERSNKQMPQSSATSNHVGSRLVQQRVLCSFESTLCLTGA